jgi:hypothetical protein
MTFSVVLSLMLGAIGVVLWIEGGPNPRTAPGERLVRDEHDLLSTYTGLNRIVNAKQSLGD